MIIAIDYDETFTRDPAGWLDVIGSLKSRGHTVYCVTARDADCDGNKVRSDLGHAVDDCFFTSGAQKELFMLSRNICVHVWIDDQPMSIVRKDLREQWEVDDMEVISQENAALKAQCDALVAENLALHRRLAGETLRADLMSGRHDNALKLLHLAEVELAGFRAVLK